MKRRNVAGVSLGALGLAIFFVAVVVMTPSLSLWWPAMVFAGWSFLSFFTGAFIFSSPEFPEFSDILFWAAGISAFILGLLLVINALNLSMRAIASIAGLTVITIEGLLYYYIWRPRQKKYKAALKAQRELIYK